MGLPKDAQGVKDRLTRARTFWNKRDELINLVRSMYALSFNRKSSYLGANAGNWRTKVPVEYWEASNRPQNAIDTATAVLAGYAPQYQVTQPEGDVGDTASRAEKFLLGVLRLNSRRQGADLVRRLIFNTVQDGGAVARVTWLPDAPDPTMESKGSGAEIRLVASYRPADFPICVDVLPWSQVYPMGKGPRGRPFSEIMYANKMSVANVVDAWQKVEGSNLATFTSMTEGERAGKEVECVEWWGYADGGVYHAFVAGDVLVRPPTEVPYPDIPYVITQVKEADSDSPDMSHVPFIHPILWAVDREEYMRSRILRIVDMLANLVPVHQGGQPINMTGTWGAMLNLNDPLEKISFPAWPGNPPDVWRLLEDIQRRESEGTFSSAMYGEVSSRLSGYGLSQLVGGDTLRMDTPRSNLELAFGSIGDLIFGELRTFCPGIYLSVTIRVRQATLAAVLSGDETKGLVIDCLIKPKQAADEQRLAALGAQLASLPKPPVSMRFILENYFGLAQPEDEISRVMEEDAMRDPIVRMVAMLQVLSEHESPYAPFVAMALQKALSAAIEPPKPPGSIPGLGLGLPQAIGGNEPMPGPTGEVGAEVGPTPETMRMGGPME